MELVFLVLKIFLELVLLLVSVAFLSLFERKFLGYSQSRKGPNLVWFMGCFQPFADAIKLISKVDSVPEKSSPVGFYLPPILFFFISLGSWVAIPHFWNLVNFPSSGLFLVFWMSISVYGLIFSGWLSYCKYSTLGVCRAIAQSISYEIVLTFSILGVFMIFGSVSLVKIFFLTSDLPLLFFSPFLFLCFFISLLAESNRTPFDLPESESELVGGYSVEYGSVSYTILFLGENLSIIFSCYFLACFIFGGCMIMLKFSILLIIFIWIRSTLPRIRFDKIMSLCWLELVPLTLGGVLVYSIFS